MMTYRSNHMPMLTKIEITNSAVMYVRTFLDQRSHGKRPLQMFIVQLAHQYGPNARYQNAARSAGLPLNQATRFSKWWTVMISSSPKSLRIGTSSVITIPTPE